MILRHAAIAIIFALLLGISSLPYKQISVAAAGKSFPTPEQFLGFRVGEDKKLARWDRIVEYMRIVAGDSDRVRMRELGKSTNGNPFILLEISSPETIKNLDHYKQLERK